MVGRRDLCKAIESEGRVMSEWQLTVFGDLIDVKHGWAFKGEFFNETNHPKNVVVAIGNFNYSGGFRFDSTRIKEYLDFYPEEYKLTPGEILLAMTCQTAGGEILGIPGRIPEDGKTYLHNQRLGKIKIKNSYTTDSSFIYWLCLWHDFNHHLVATATGTKILHTAPERIKSFTFKCPPIDEQKQIGKTLDSLDRKISNLRQQNETLEKIAQTLFKHWFVDFEFPNEDGKPYKSSGGEMVRSELGEIPVGWRVGKLKDLVIVNPQESIKKGSFIKYIDMRSLSTSGMEITEFITREFTSGSKFRNSDTLLARITPCLENGKTAFVNVLDKNEVAYGSTEFIVMRASSICCPEYVYCLARSSFFRDYAIKNMTGSSGRQRVPNDRVENYEVEIPATEITQAFHEICNSFFLRIKSNQRQIQTLTQTRDRLLPKLMSGQLRITD
jgi:type I restriction enzyme, S subunit